MAIAKFLNTEAGMELLDYLKWATPSVVVDPNPHVMQFTSGVTQGWNNCATTLDKLSSIKDLSNADEVPDTLER